MSCLTQGAHDGLRDPSAPGRAFTPNEKYASLIQAAGYLPVALSAEDYIELLPAQWRTVNAYGIKLRHRTYDSAELPDPGERSGVKSKKDLWEVHYDPYDITRVWVRDHWKKSWITVPWKHLGTSPIPFGEVAWDHAIRTLRDRGDAVDEGEHRRRGPRLLQRAHSGPREVAGERFTPREQRVLAREHATARQPAPGPEPEPALPEAAISAEEEEDLDNVVPLKVLDARKAAEEW